MVSEFLTNAKMANNVYDFFAILNSMIIYPRLVGVSIYVEVPTLDRDPY